MTAGAVIERDDFRRQDFRQMLKFSVAGHALLSLGLVTSSFFAPSAMMMPAVLNVELVAAPSASRAAAKPTAVPPAPKPKPKQVVLPEHANIPKPSAKPKEVVLQPKPKVEKSLDDLMNEFREDLGETPPVTEAAVQQPTAAGTGVGQVISAEEMAWRRAVRTKVKKNWVVAPGFRLLSLRTDVEVLLNSSGDVMGTRIVKRSGNPWFDESVERGIDKASPLPAPPEPGEWPFSFNSEETL